MVDSPNEVPESDVVPTIKDLIRVALDSGQTLRDLERRSDNRVNFQTFQKLSKAAPKAFPEKETIKGIADALEVPETTVVLAFAKSLGVAIETESGFAMQLPRGIDQLDDEMQRAILAIARAAVRSASAAAQSVAVPDEPKKTALRRSLGRDKNPGVNGSEQGKKRHDLGGG